MVYSNVKLKKWEMIVLLRLILWDRISHMKVQLFRIKLFSILILILLCGTGYSQESVKPEKMYEIEGHKTVVEIFASVPDVNVYINGTYQGKTNLELFDLTPGFYQLRLEKRGYAEIEEVIYVKNRYGQRFWFDLKK